MYAKTKTLKVTCPTNPDYNVILDKEDIAQNMLELDYQGDWIDYALERVFEDEPEFTAALHSIFHFANLRKVTLQFGDDYVTIEKVK